MNLKLISNLKFAEKLNATNPVTESGKEMLKNYKAYLFSNESTYGLVNGFIREASQFTFDTGIMSILESVLNYVNENKISWKLASACESINADNSQYNYISKLGVKQVDSLLEMDENQVVQYIKAGALKNIQYIPEFRAICKEVYRTNVVEETYTPNYSLVSPISYIIMNENVMTFAIYNKAYKISEGVVEETTVDDPTFNRINSIIGNFKKVDEGLEYSYKHGALGQPYNFKITESNITFSTPNFSQTFESAAGLREYADTFARALFGNDKVAFLNVTNCVAETFDTMENICEIDTAKVLETSAGDVLAIIESKENVNVTVFRSACGTSSNNYKLMTEALADVKKVTNLNLNGVYEKRLNEDTKRLDPDSYESIKEALEANKQQAIESRRRKIELLAEQYKNDPVRISLLNNIARELNMLDA